MTGGTELSPCPDEPDDEYPGYLWPAEDDERDEDWPGARNARTSASRRAGGTVDAAVPVQWEVPPAPAYAPPASRSRRRLLPLAGTAVLACALGAGAMLAYRGALPEPAPAAAVSQGTVEDVELVGRVISVVSGTVTIGGGPALQVTATVTRATRFTGTVRTLAGVHEGDTVEAQITILNGAARVVSLRDPASES